VYALGLSVKCRVCHLVWSPANFCEIWLSATVNYVNCVKKLPPKFLPWLWWWPVCLISWWLVTDSILVSYNIQNLLAVVFFTNREETRWEYLPGLPVWYASSFEDSWSVCLAAHVYVCFCDTSVTNVAQLRLTLQQQQQLMRQKSTAPGMLDCKLLLSINWNYQAKLF
jgi:hypothetical protein